jgi:GT2 family glycosyltransferase
MMISAVLRVVVVLYRSRLKTIRPVLEAIAAARIGAPVIVSVIINRDDLGRGPRKSRRVRMDANLALEVTSQDNEGGVANAYNFVIERGLPTDVIILLDADSRLPAAYFSEVWALRERLSAALLFVAPELYSDSLRVSPYRLSGLVPFAIDGELDRERPMKFSSGIGVINAGLAGSIRSFRQISGFSRQIGLDLSDVAWSLRAAQHQAELLLLSIRHTHHLSIRTRGFGFRRLQKYLTACLRLSRETGEYYSGFRLAARGLKALRWQRPAS